MLVVSLSRAPVTRMHGAEVALLGSLYDGVMLEIIHIT